MLTDNVNFSKYSPYKTVHFVGTGTQAINGTAPSQTFNNIILNSTGTLTVSGSTTSLTTSDFTQTAGSFTAPANFDINGVFRRHTHCWRKHHSKWKLDK